MIVNLLFTILLVVASVGAEAGEILLIGDSLTCGPFGKYLLQNLSARGNQVTLFCAVSSAPSNWLAGKNPSGQKCQTMSTRAPALVPCDGTGKIPRLSDILAAHKGSRILVALGTNSLLQPKADASYKRMAELVATNSSSCDWIGPPHLNPSQSKGFPPGRIAKEEKNLAPFYESLAGAVEKPCHLIDSRNATVAGGPGNQTVDGVHRTESAGKYWADALTNQLLKPSLENASPQTAQ